jgi:hypothetical protein
VRRRITFALVVLASLLLQGCPPPSPGENPSITITNGQNVLIISGRGFANVGLCAHLSMQSPQTGPVVIGDPSCSGGGFADFPFAYSYAGCKPQSTTTVSIFAQDPNSSAGASQSIQIPWGTNCILAKAACLNSGAACVACGGEGEPVCSNGACVEPDCSFAKQQNGVCVATQPDLHPTLSGSQLICTANCGHTQGYTPCYPYMDGCNVAASYPSTIIAPQNTCVTSPSGLNTFSCYDNSMIEPNGQCTCVPSSGTCPVNSSPGNGICASSPC